MKLKLIALTVTMLAVTACEQKEFNTDQQRFEAYLQTKRVSLEDKDRAERLRGEFKRRGALANAIYKSGDLDTALVDAELEEFRKELLISRYFEQYLNKAVTDQGIQNFYSENIDRYKSKKTKVSHILFRTNSRMDDIARQAVLTTATAAYSRLTSGEDFASAKVFSMNAGELSEPFQTDFGFHIVKVVEAPQEVTKPLASLKGDIRYQMRNQSKKAETKRLLELAGYQAKTTKTSEK